MTVNGVGSYGTFAVSGSSGRNVKSGQSVRFNFQAAGEKADNLLAGMKELDTGKRSSDRSNWRTAVALTAVIGPKI